jgi:hypothetical protein
LSTERNNMIRVIIAHGCALAVAGVFLYAAQSKIIQPGQFAIDVGNYRIVPQPLLNLVALFLPWWEAGAAVALIFTRTRRAGAIFIAAMCLMFIAAVSYAAFYKGYHISCGCFGKDGSTDAGIKTVALDLALLIATAVAVYLPPRKATATAQSDDFAPTGAVRQPA